MRNRRLLTLAVLAVAIGFAASAQAGDANSPYGTAVVTLIQQDSVAGVGTFDINMRLWDNAGVGATAQTPGLLDFVFKAVYGTGGLAVTGVSNTAPYGEVTLDGNTVAGGFNGSEKLGINYAGQNYSAPGVPIPGNYSVVGLQPVAYDANTGPNSPLRDAAILYGVGTAGRTLGDPTQNNVGTWSADPNTFAGDTPVAHGTYSDSGLAGSLVVDTYGVDSFDCLPGALGSVFVGPTADANTFGRPVTAVLIQTITGAGAASNDGGAAPSNTPVTVKLAVGNVTLGSQFVSGQAATAGNVAIANMTLVLDANGIDTKVTLGASHILAGLQIATGLAGNQALDLASPATSGQYHSLSIYSGDLPATETAVIAMIAAGTASGDTQGLYDSSLSSHANSAIGVTDQALDDNGDQYVLIRPTIKGDANCDGTTEFADLQTITSVLNWQATGDGTWDRGDFNGDGDIEFADLQIITSVLHWQQSYAPEPASMLLLAMGAVGVLAHRRRK